MENSEPSRISLGTLITESWVFCKGNFLTICLITAAVYLPANVLSYFIYPYTTGNRTLQLLSTLLLGFIYLIAAAAIVYITDANAEVARKAGFQKAMKAGLVFWIIAILTTIVQGLIIVPLVLLFIIPGVIWMIYYKFTIQAIVLRGLKYKTALNYSKEIVRGNWFLVFGYSLVISLVPMLLSYGSEYLFRLYMETIPWIDIVKVIRNVFFDLINVFPVVASTLLFKNLEQIKLNEPSGKNDFPMRGFMDRLAEKTAAIDESQEPDDKIYTCPVCSFRLSKHVVVCPVCRATVDFNQGK